MVNFLVVGDFSMMTSSMLVGLMLLVMHFHGSFVMFRSVRSSLSSGLVQCIMSCLIMNLVSLVVFVSNVLFVWFVLLDSHLVCFWVWFLVQVLILVLREKIDSINKSSRINVLPLTIS